MEMCSSAESAGRADGRVGFKSLGDRSREIPHSYEINWTQRTRRLQSPGSLGRIIPIRCGLLNYSQKILLYYRILIELSKCNLGCRFDEDIL